MDDPRARSLARLALQRLAAPVALVVVTVAGLTYLHLRATLYAETARQLDAYVEQRVARERLPFELVADQGRAFREDFLRRRPTLDGAAARAAIDARAVAFGDGTWRTPASGYDPALGPSMFLGPQHVRAEDSDRDLALAFDMIGEIGRFATRRYPDLYFTTASNAMVLYWPTTPWIHAMTPDFDMRVEPYVTAHLPANNPSGAQAWTPLYFDKVAATWMMSFVTPIYVDGRHVGAISQDLLLDDLLARTAHDALPGTHNVIFRRADEVLIHAPGLERQIQEAGGTLHLADTRTATLVALRDALQAAGGVAGTRVHETDDALLGVGEIPGPDWVFVAVYPKALIQSRALEAARLVFAVGLASLLVQLALMARVLRRWVSAPLARLTAVAAELGRGELSVRASRAGQGEAAEVQALAASFDHMAEAVEARDRRLAEHAESLERRVAERTAELGRRNEDLRHVLDAVDQGLLTISLDGELSRERSAAVERWLGPAPTSERFADYLRPHDAQAAWWLDEGLEALRAGELPDVVSIEQLPKRLVVGERTLALAYAPIADDTGRTTRLLVVISDVTAALALERAEAEQAEQLAVFARVRRDVAEARAFVDEAARLVEQLRVTAAHDEVVARRALHTLKGNAAMFGLTSVATVCHAVEEAAREGALDDAGIARVEAAWAAARARIEGLLPTGPTGIEVPVDALHEVVATLRASGTPRAIVVAIEQWAHEPTRRRLETLGEQARALARRLGRGELAVEVVDDGARVEPGRFGALWASLVHLVRNAVDHGLEPVEARAMLGKGAPRLRLEATRLDAELVLRVADDGRGIDWDAVASRAARLGLPHHDRAALEACLFADGLSTRDEVTDTSGRGVGMSAVREAVDALGGTIRVATQAGRGTCFELRLPLEAAARSPAQRAA